MFKAVLWKKVWYAFFINLISSILFRFFGGLILDIKRKAPFFWSDFRDALSLQCLASFLFLYCACMSPVITFGGLLGEATEGRIVCVKILKQTYIPRFVVSIFFLLHESPLNSSISRFRRL